MAPTAKTPSTSKALPAERIAQLQADRKRILDFKEEQTKIHNDNIERSKAALVDLNAHVNKVVAEIDAQLNAK